ncbi:MAG TPA: PhzF family phenazine biosynthesis protein [Steroidobacteraceae bacterium]|jgi:PhzF family phenazine biosynthesis protein
MATLNFRILNVFTQNHGRLTGNPLCVFEDGQSLDNATMQALARQFNLSETTFLLPSSVANARVRIFTPAYEMSFAGHPTLGSAFVCRALGHGTDELNLEMQAGIIPVRAQGDRWTLQAKAPTWRDVDASRGALAAMLSLDENDIGDRPLWVKAGKEQLVIPLRDEAAVRRARPRSELFAAVKSDEGHSMAYVFAATGTQRLLSRFFFSQDGAIIEDPATGSATANLGGWFVAMNRPLPQSYEISQGEYVARPSTLYLEVDAERRIFVGGEVVELGRGTIQI